MTTLTRRDLAILATAAAAAASGPTYAQNASYAGEGVKLSVIVDQELPGFPLQMTRLTIAEFEPRSSMPRHRHPAAQEIVFGMEGVLAIDIEQRGKKIINPGDVFLIPAGVIHLPRAEDKSAKVLIIHSITDKDKPFTIAYSN
jgi:quercetin dioxygenase-like cupin family protein